MRKLLIAEATSPPILPSFFVPNSSTAINRTISQ